MGVKLKSYVIHKSFPLILILQKIFIIMLFLNVHAALFFPL